MDLEGTIEVRIRELVRVHSKLEGIEALSAEQNLWDAGLESLASVRLMISIEDAFTVEFPEEVLTRETFSSIASMASAVRSLKRDSP